MGKETGWSLHRLSDEELIARCASGERDAMDVLVSRYHGKLLDFALRHLRDREASADVAQVTLVRAFRCAGAFRRQSSFRTWLYAIALNTIRDIARKTKRKPESLLSELPNSDNEPEWTALVGSGREGVACDSAEDTVMEQIDSVALWQAVDQLSEQHRTTVILRYRAELTYAEIAEVLKVPVGTARSCMHYALKALKRFLDCEEMKCAASNSNRN